MKHQLANKSALKDESKKTLPSASLQSKPPEQATMHPVLRLQRAIGNQAVQNMVRSGGMAGQPRRSSPEAISPRVDNVLRSPGQPLAPATRTFMETRFGKDFSNVRVHTDAQAAESARSINALAYTVGSDMVFGAGQYAPETIRGRRLVAHELTHTIQQTHQKQFSGSMKISEPTGAMEREAQYVACYYA